MSVEQYIESAYEARRAAMAEEAVKEVARKQEQAEKEALQLAKLREFMAQHMPEEMLDFVEWLKGYDLFQSQQLVVRAPGCVPVALILYVGARDAEYHTHDKGSLWIVPSLYISKPHWDAEENEIFAGRAEWSWGHSPKPYDWLYANDFREAIGHARERWLRLAEAEAENKRLYDELTVKNREAMARKDVEAEYVPVLEEVNPEHVLVQALREYVWRLVDARMIGAE